MPKSAQSKYYKVTNLDDCAFTLIEEGSNGICVAEKSSAQNRVAFRKIESFNRRDYCGPVKEIDKKEFDSILFDDWGYKAKEEKPKTEKAKATPKPKTEKAKDKPKLKLNLNQDK